MSPSASTSRSHISRFLRDKLYAKAKHWFNASLLCKLLGFSFAVYSVYGSVTPTYLGPLITAGFIVCAELLLWRSDGFRSVADSLHRKLDLEDSFGCKISGAELSDIIADAALNESEFTPPPNYGQNFFASSLPVSPQRGAANLVESAWWTKHLCSTMWRNCLWCLIVLFLLSFVLLYVSLNNVKSADEAMNTSKVVTSIIAFSFSVGLLRFTLGFFALRSAAAKAERLARDLAAKTEVPEMDAIKLWQDYQLARAKAPMVPTWVWKIRQKALNRTWSEFQ